MRRKPFMLHELGFEPSKEYFTALVNYVWGDSALRALFGWPGSDATRAVKALWAVGFILGGFILRPLAALLKAPFVFLPTLAFGLFKGLGDRFENTFAKGFCYFIAALAAIPQIVLRTLLAPVDAIREAYNAGEAFANKGLGVFFAVMRTLLALALFATLASLLAPLVLGAAYYLGGYAASVQVTEALAAVTQPLQALVSTVGVFIANLLSPFMPLMTAGVASTAVVLGTSAAAGVTILTAIQNGAEHRSKLDDPRHVLGSGSGVVVVNPPPPSSSSSSLAAMGGPARATSGVVFAAGASSQVGSGAAAGGSLHAASPTAVVVVTYNGAGAGNGGTSDAGIDAAADGNPPPFPRG